MSNELSKVEFESLSGLMVELDAETVRNTLTRGNGKVSDQEVAMFLRTCQAKRLDPLENGEVYLIKYDDKVPAQLVVGYHAYIRRADHFPEYRGFSAGVCVVCRIDGKLLADNTGRPVVERREGSAVYKTLGEELVGGWCRVYRLRRDGNVGETYAEVSLDEYSTGQSNWKSKPATMLRKVAISQAFRAAFPNEYEGIYTMDEMQASGAIPEKYKVNDETGEIIDVEDVVDKTEEDPLITDEQRKMLLKMTQEYLGGIDKEQANSIYKVLLQEQGVENAKKLTVSSYGKVLERLAEISSEIAASKAETDSNQE